MKAAVFNRYGGNEVVEVRDILLPRPGPRDVLVKVRAASVNPLDWKVRAGMARIFTGSKFPKVLGSECAGEVAETGDRSTRFRKGDPVVVVAGVRRLGAFAEYVCASDHTVFPLTGGLSPEQAACIPIAGLTALQGLRTHGRIAAFQKVLVIGASGGVGHFAVQIAKVFGAHVTAVCSGRNLDFVRALGADRAVDYTQEDVTNSGERFDLVFDTVSARSFLRCARVLTPNGRYVNTLPNLTLVAQFITSILPGKKARSMWVRPDASDAAWLMDQAARGAVRVSIDRIYPLDQVRDALAYSESGRVRGKIVLQVFPPPA
jgi:NADPH:quinone reductase-like Zn-dependent oxidoreductase